MQQSPNEIGRRAAPGGQPDLLLGSTVISPVTRTVSGFSGRASLEPQMMQVLLCLAERPGGLVTRAELLDRCWNGIPVGDDSLNRAIAGIRRAIRQAAGDALRIETVSGSGYVLNAAAAPQVRQNREDASATLEDAWQWWKLGLPSVNQAILDQLRRTAAAHPDRSDVLGVLALTLRTAAEYADLDLCPSLVRECEAAAARAIALNGGQSHARAALIGLPPLYGDWHSRRTKLLEALDSAPDDAVLIHDLSILEMATGRPRAAAALNARLMEIEPFAATFHYKRTYLTWSTGQLIEMDHVADRAMQLWPRHPAIWFARLWSLAFTGRAGQAMQQLTERSSRPDLPAPALLTAERTLAALLGDGNEEAHRRAVQMNLEAAERGPAQSVASIIHLAGLGEVEAAMQVAEGYLLRRGPISVSVHRTEADPRITDQHRRVTQMLFLPVTKCLRDDPRFLALCERIGLVHYWNAAGVEPDFIAAG